VDRESSLEAQKRKDSEREEARVARQQRYGRDPSESAVEARQARSERLGHEIEDAPKAKSKAKAKPKEEKTEEPVTE
jgi:hypothetical protein